MHFNQAPQVSQSPQKQEYNPKEKLAQAISDGFRHIELQLEAKKEPYKMFEVNGRGYPVTTEFDRTMAEIQEATRLTQEYLSNQEGYREQQGGAKILEALNAVQALALIVGEMKALNVKPALIASLVERVTSPGGVTKDSANDEKFLVKQTG
jgi:hypothetical protein